MKSFKHGSLDEFFLTVLAALCFGPRLAPICLITACSVPVVTPPSVMSAASVAAPMTTSYIQSPSRFASPSEAAAAARARQLSQQQGPAPASFSSSAPHFEGFIPRVKDDQTHPVTFSPAKGNPYSLQQQSPITTTAQARTPPRQQQQEPTQRLPSVRASPSRFEQSRVTRVNPNSRTSAAFPLAVTAQQKAETAARKLAERLDWEEEQERMAQAQAQAAAEAADERAYTQQQSSAAEAFASSSSPSFSRSSSSSIITPTVAEAKLAQAALYARQLKDCKISFRDRVVPPTPDYPEDPLTAHASEHTGL